MQNLRTAINDDPRRAWIASLGDLSAPAQHHTGSDPDDPRKTYVQRLQDAWRRNEEDDGVEHDDSVTPTMHNDAVRFKDASSFDASPPAVPSGLPTGATLRLLREQRHNHFGGAA